MLATAGTTVTRTAGPITRLALLIAAGVLALAALALVPEPPADQARAQGTQPVPTSERLYDGRGKWTGY